MIRLVHLLRRAPNLSQQEFSQRWRDHNGPLVAAAQTELDLIRYLPVHPDPADQGIGRAAAAARGGMALAFDGVAEYWWRSEAALRVALSAAGGKAAAEQLVADERGFIDLPASPMWFATEFPQVATGLLRPVARIRSDVMRLHFAIRPLPVLSEDEARRYWPSTAPSFDRTHRRGDCSPTTRSIAATARY